MGNYFSKLASSSKDKGIVMVDLTKLTDAPNVDDEDRKDKKERSKKTKNERQPDSCRKGRT